MSTNFEGFAALMAKLRFLYVDEQYADETYTLRIKCGATIVVERNLIKCTCETREEMQAFVMPLILEDLFKIGRDEILKKCEGRHEDAQ